MFIDYKYDIDGGSSSYLPPMAIAVSLDAEQALAKSNTEQIIVDDGEYGWI
jgi:hypothetical protein